MVIIPSGSTIFIFTERRGRNRTTSGPLGWVYCRGNGGLAFFFCRNRSIYALQHDCSEADATNFIRQTLTVGELTSRTLLDTSLLTALNNTGSGCLDELGTNDENISGTREDSLERNETERELEKSPTN